MPAHRRHHPLHRYQQRGVHAPVPALCAGHLNAHSRKMRRGSMTSVAYGIATPNGSDLPTAIKYRVSDIREAAAPTAVHAFPGSLGR